jgi:hypothetical protein
VPSYISGSLRLLLELGLPEQAMGYGLGLGLVIENLDNPTKFS